MEQAGLSNDGAEICMGSFSAPALCNRYKHSLCGSALPRVVTTFCSSSQLKVKFLHTFIDPW